MTEQELLAIGERYAPPPTHAAPDEDADVLALLGEVRRLQGLIKQAEWGSAGHTAEGDVRAVFCFWCERYRHEGHQPTCPAFGSEA